jgi:hypothetical protein
MKKHNNKMNLDDRQTLGYNILELWIINQRYTELLDDLNLKNHPLKNKKLNQALKGIYPMLDKETKNFSEIHGVSPDGTNQFYDIIVENSKFIRGHHLLDKSMICSFLIAHEKDPKAVEGIISKVIKRKK